MQVGAETQFIQGLRAIPRAKRILCSGKWPSGQRVQRSGLRPHPAFSGVELSHSPVNMTQWLTGLPVFWVAGRRRVGTRLRTAFILVLPIREPRCGRFAVAYCTCTVALSAMSADELPIMRLTGPVSTRKAWSFASQYASREAGRAISTVFVALGCT